eukprot:TRINITY_DN82425_c0_g1_i1.p2 TRINITY_DN82425_c0_g1~~TRINITY_DN82425_c0_g1_i1.p2  ORF type:complete len:173 (+),score=14.71 TRINITY_DN82425_c0_g1_i1:43-519(+)
MLLKNVRRLLSVQVVRMSANMTYGKAGTRTLVAYGLCSSIGMSAFTYHVLLQKRSQRRPFLRKAWEALWAGPSSRSSSCTDVMWQVRSFSISEDAALAVGVGAAGPVAIGYVAGGLRRCIVGMSSFEVVLRRPLLMLVMAPFTLVGSIGGVVAYKLLA